MENEQQNWWRTDDQSISQCNWGSDNSQGQTSPWTQNQPDYSQSQANLLQGQDSSSTGQMYNNTYNGICSGAQDSSTNTFAHDNNAQQHYQAVADPSSPIENFWSYLAHMEKQNKLERDPNFCALSDEERYKYKLMIAKDEDELSDYTRVIHNIGPHLYGHNELEIRMTGFCGVDSFPLHMLNNQNTQSTQDTQSIPNIQQSAYYNVQKSVQNNPAIQFDPRAMIRSDYCDDDLTMKDDCDSLSCISGLPAYSNNPASQNKKTKSNSSYYSPGCFKVVKEKPVRLSGLGSDLQVPRREGATMTKVANNPTEVGRDQDKEYVSRYFR